MADHIHYFRDKEGREVEIRMNRPTLDPNTVDEIVTSEIHLEQMDLNRYWMEINGVHFWFTARGKIELTYHAVDADEVTP